MDDMYSPDPLSGMESGKGLYAGQQAAPSGLCACFSLAFYKPYFNVDTSDVKDRMVKGRGGRVSLGR
jgi:hypothetical protein